ncbi:caspase, EACC1-associated type [Amycolatopsis lurida]
MSGVDFARSRAILVGTAQYSRGLTAMPAARNSLRAMRELLTGPRCGWPAARVTSFENKTTRDRVDQKIAKLIHETTDVLLFYYVGHGQLLDGEHLGLALGDTHSEPNMRHATSLRMRELRTELKYRCRARVKIVILDCCFAGLATRHTQGSGLAEQVQLATKVEGAYTLAAARYWQQAHYEDGRDGLTYFTRFFTETLRDGVPGAGEWLTLGDIQTVVAARCREVDLPDGAVRPEPSTLVVDTAERFPFARNAAWTPAAAAGPPVVIHSVKPRSSAARRALSRRSVFSGAAAAAAVGALGWQVPELWALLGPPPTGTRRWNTALGLESIKRPAVSGDTVYVAGSSAAGSVSAGSVVALDVATGAKRWSFLTGEESNPVAPADGRVHLRASDGDTTTVHALTAATGERQWSYQVPGGTATGMIVGDGAVYLSDTEVDPYLCALDAASGAVRWRKPQESRQQPPTLSNGVLFSETFGGDDAKPQVVALDPATGHELWRIPGEREHFGALASRGDLVFGYSAGDPGSNSMLLAWDKETGEERWNLPLVVDISPLELADGVLYLFTDDGKGDGGALYAIETATGTVKWSAQAKRRSSFSPISLVVGDGVVYFGADSVYALDTETGAQRWKAPFEDMEPSPLVLAGGKVFLTVWTRKSESDVHLHALDAATGKERWIFPVGSKNEAPGPVVAGSFLCVPDSGGISALDF